MLNKILAVGSTILNIWSSAGPTCPFSNIITPSFHIWIVSLWVAKVGLGDGEVPFGGVGGGRNGMEGLLLFPLGGGSDGGGPGGGGPGGGREGGDLWLGDWLLKDGVAMGMKAFAGVAKGGGRFGGRGLELYKKNWK